MTRLMMIAASAAALMACAPMAPMGGPMAPAGMTMPTQAMPYAQMAAASDLFEIQSSQIALQVSQNAGVRTMAQMLINDHTMTSQQLMAAAQASGMPMPAPVLDARKMAMIEQLRSTPAQNFDMVWMMMQATAHQEALALHSTYAARGDNARLRVVAGAAVPVVTRHLNDARRMHSM